MEAPTSSAVSATTMIAAKRAVMVDHLLRAINDVAYTNPDDREQLSPVYPTRSGHRPRAKSRSADRPARESPLTCANCRLTYLPFAVPAASGPHKDRLCDGCQQSLG